MTAITVLLAILLASTAAVACLIRLSTRAAKRALTIDFAKYDRFLSPVSFGLIGLLLGVAAYTMQITRLQEHLFDEVGRADVLNGILKESPGYPYETLVDAKKPIGRDLHALRIWLDRFDMSRGTEVDELSAADSRFACLAKLIAGTSNRCDLLQRVPDADWLGGTVSHLVTLASQMGNNASGDASTDPNGKPRDKQRQTIVEWLGAAIARQPADGNDHGFAAYFVEIEPADKAGRDVRLAPRSCSFFQFIAHGEPCMFSRPDQVSIDKLLHALHNRMLTGKGDAERHAILRIHQFYDSTDKRVAAQTVAQLETVLVFEAALARALLLDRNVVEAAADLNFWVGYEQCAIVCLSFALALLLVRAWIKEMPQSAMSKVLLEKLRPYKAPSYPPHKLGPQVVRDIYESTQKELTDRGKDPQHFQALTFARVLSDEADMNVTVIVAPGSLAGVIQDESIAIEDRRWFFGWGLAAIPALGFLGTVRGILAAIGGVGEMAGADNRLSSAVTIGNVSGSLSLAFSTTMLALLAVLILGVIDQWQVAGYRRQLNELEENLRLLAPPARKHP